MKQPAKEKVWRAILVEGVILLLLCGLIWAPRVAALAAFVTIDEPVWLDHTLAFADGLIHRDWAMTFRLEHPGVTTLWLGVLGLLQRVPDYAQRILTDPERYRQPLETWLSMTTGVTPLALLAATRWWVTLAVALTLAASYFPLRRLVGRGNAIVTLLFVAWSPMAVAFSRQLQPDGLLASTCLAALSYFLAWLYTGQRWRDLAISGGMMGLAWLTKIPAALLVPTGALLLFSASLEKYRNQQESKAIPLLLGPWQTLLVGYVGWGLLASVTFFALWPALWVDPVGSFQHIWATMTKYADGHANPNFFWGQVVDDPGPFFYPVAYLLRSTPATLIGLVLAGVASWRQQGLFCQRLVRKSAGGMLIFALVFALVMTVIDKKFDRYLLPAFLALDVIAALGWVALSQATYRRFRPVQTMVKPWWHQGAWWASGAILVVALGPLHGFFTAQHYPYYMTYYNPWLGGAQTAEQVLFVGWGEGLEQVGAWLNRQPAAAEKQVLAWYATGPLSYFFVGDAISVLYGSRMPWLDADYVVLYANQVQRGIPTWAAVDYFRRQQPIYTVSSHGLTLARLYDLRALMTQLLATVPTPRALPIHVAWPAQQLTVLRSLPTSTIASVLPVEFAWQGVLDGANKVSVRLINEQGDLIAQEDATITATMTLPLFIPPDAKPGTYTLFLLIYHADSLEPVLTTDGQSLVPLQVVEITAHPE
ncbi:MAG: glycosyltransferase family 39 protein [Caldilineaceae bacterium]|nr:glycosyltransferase family 39 protein [Caldilineaceae bacterium]